MKSITERAAALKALRDEYENACWTRSDALATVEEDAGGMERYDAATGAVAVVLGKIRRECRALAAIMGLEIKSDITKLSHVNAVVYALTRRVEAVEEIIAGSVRNSSILKLAEVATEEDNEE